MDLKQKVFMAARDVNINSILFQNAVARKLGLSTTDAACLGLLGIKGVSTPKELARYTGLTSGSTTAMLDRLEKRNFIRRKNNPDDRRGVLIEINEEYSRKVWPLVTGIQKGNNELITKYSDKELEIIADFLKRFADNVIDHTKKIEKGL